MFPPIEMKKQLRAKVLSGICLSVLFLLPQLAFAQKERVGEYVIKANVLVRFLRWVDWPPESLTGDTIIIRVIGKDPDPELFERNIGKLFKGKSLEIRHHRRFKEDLVVDDCHLLFICRGEKKYTEQILEKVKGLNILTVGEANGFVEDQGGMVNFVVDKNSNVKFEINQKAASETGLRIHSSLLAVALKVIRKESE